MPNDLPPPAADATGNAAAPPRKHSFEGFEHWSREWLALHDERLATQTGRDGSARMTLAAFGSHRFRMIRRLSDGPPELHDHEIDVVFVQSGRGTLMLGGTLVDKKAMVTPAGERPAGEWVGTRLEGGDLHPLNAGDIVHIPAGVPHTFLVPERGSFTYVLLKLPAPAPVQ